MLLSNRSGSRSGRRCTSGFQSLLSWMLLSNIVALPISARNVRMFQSLLSWMLLSNLMQFFYFLTFTRFQSLLSWMLLSNLVFIVHFLFSITSFNPCYPGCCSQTFPIEDAYLPKSICFNPCYPGCCSQTSACIISAGIGYLVSILVILDVALKPNLL